MKFLRNKKNSRWELADTMFLSLFLTGTIIEFSQVGAGFIDGLIISRCLSAEAMAAEGIIYPIFSITGIISGLLAVGMQVLCSQFLGRGNKKDFSRYFSATAYVGIAASVILMILVLIFAKPIAALLGASGNAANLLEPAVQYLKGLGFGIPFLIMTAILSPAIELDSGRKTIQIGAFITTVSNVIFDLLAIKFGMGIFGVGLATSVSTALNLLYQCSHFLKKDRMLHFVKPNVTIKEFASMLVNGGERAIRCLANTIRPIFLNTIIIAYGGSTAMSVLSVYNNFANLTGLIGTGIASAFSLLTGFYYGEINKEAIEEANSYKYKLISVFPGFVFLLVLLFSRFFAGLYIVEEGEIKELTVFALRMLALQVPLQAVIENRIKYLQAAYLKLNMNLLLFAAKLVFIVLSAFILGKTFGVRGILASYTVSDALSLFAVYIFCVIKKHSLLPKMNDFLYLPKEFQIKPGDVISLDIRDMEEVSLGSSQIMLFCKGHKFDRKISYYAALAFEELAKNIVQHGFPQCKSSHPMIDLRVVIKENTLVIRLRDNCPKYDITQFLAAVNSDTSDTTANIGTRIVGKIASDINYIHTFETNNLLISFKLDAE